MDSLLNISAKCVHKSNVNKDEIPKHLRSITRDCCEFAVETKNLKKHIKTLTKKLALYELGNVSNDLSIYLPCCNRNEYLYVLDCMKSSPRKGSCIWASKNVLDGTHKYANFSVHLLNQCKPVKGNTWNDILNIASEIYNLHINASNDVIITIDSINLTEKIVYLGAQNKNCFFKQAVNFTSDWNFHELDQLHNLGENTLVYLYDTPNCFININGPYWLDVYAAVDKLINFKFRFQI